MTLLSVYIFSSSNINLYPHLKSCLSKLSSIIMLLNAVRKIFGIKILESKASLVLTQLNQSVSVDSNISTTSLFAGRERMTFDLSFSMQPFKALAELRFRGMSLRIFCFFSDQFSKIFCTVSKYLKNYINHS